MDPTAQAQTVQAALQTVAVQPGVLGLIAFTKALILPTLFLTFFGAVTLRIFIYYTVRREWNFVREFERRAADFLKHDGHTGSRSFFVLCKRLLEQTYYEMFESRAIERRRTLDYITDPSDRLFLVQPGTAHLVRDTLREIQFIKYDGNQPPLLQLIKDVFASNPCFTRVLGLLPVQAFNDLLNVIPGLFIVAGIFGTFLGIMQALPELGAMNIRDPESTKLVMDTFLAKIAFSMSTSTVGIMLSVVTTVFNNFLSPERLFIRLVDRFERCLFRLWSRCDNNLLPAEIPDFDEHRDPLEALAAMAVERATGEPAAPPLSVVGRKKTA